MRLGPDTLYLFQTFLFSEALYLAPRCQPFVSLSLWYLSQHVVETNVTV